MRGVRARRAAACSAAVREALVRLSRTPLGRGGRQPLPADVNRDCREALLEIINHHISGPLKTVEFIAKVARRRRAIVTRPPLLGIRHVALYVGDLAAAERFWVDVMGYAVEWRPDPDNVYLCGGARQPGAAPAGRRRRRAASTTSASPSPARRRRRRLGRATSSARRRR